MHEYILSNHDRKLIYYCVALLSSLAGSVFAFLLTMLNASMGIVLAAPSGFAVFGLFLVCFLYCLIYIYGSGKLFMILAL